LHNHYPPYDIYLHNDGDDDDDDDDDGDGDDDDDVIIYLGP